MSTRAEILNGADFEGYEDFCAEVINAIKNHYRISDPTVNMVARQPGEILSDPDDDKLYHVGGASGYPCDEILQATRSCDVIPEFKGVDYYDVCHGDYARIVGIDEPGLGHRLTIGLDETARTMVICDLGDIAVDFGLAPVNFPTTYWMDADADSYFFIGWDSDDLPKLEVGGNAVKIGIYSDLFTDRWLESDTNTFIGIDVAGSGNLVHGAGDEGWYNCFFGRAGFNNTTGYFNNFFGYNTGNANTTGYSNNFFGNVAGNANTTGLFNTFFGQAAGLVNTSGHSNNFFGRYAGGNITTGDYNIMFGRDATALSATLNYQLNIGNAIYGDMTPGSREFHLSGLLAQKYIVTIDDVDGNETHIIAEMMGGLIRRGTGNQLTANRTDISDTAANIVAGILGCVVGSGFEFSIANEDGTHTVNLSGGVGVTMIPNAPSTAIPVLSTGRFMLVVTNIGGGTEAVNIHSLGYSIH